MKTMLLFALSLIFNFGTTFAQRTASEVLENAIAYHDPNGNWTDFDDSFQVVMTTPDKADRVSVITINLPENYFNVTATRDGATTQYTIANGACVSHAKENASAEALQQHCETATLYKNYYTYLYGLPMKLKDPGANLDPEVAKVTFKGKEYLRLKVTYDETVGTDLWFFYFNPTTYAMEVYQFFKGDPTKEGKNTGEYILLSEEAEVGGIKLPKVRAWYYNKDDSYLGTDTLKG